MVTDYKIFVSVFSLLRWKCPSKARPKRLHWTTWHRGPPARQAEILTIITLTFALPSALNCIPLAISKLLTVVCWILRNRYLNRNNIITARTGCISEMSDLWFSWIIMIFMSDRISWIINVCHPFKLLFIQKLPRLIKAKKYSLISKRTLFKLNTYFSLSVFLSIIRINLPVV